ncbi:DUF2169 domain-containing protein [Massilia sp. CCM 9210]|uniref:DUF2169 family type VI secretion system accessory protein n=1 Tax=Massilia scottii TaxID=3057166 RepID=UPI002796687A|nr:DUF2169 domain-containing protein [Massilia sp. CCM 9210]MDQ1812406.1 DUF2169 domain-containing protein [Massilia sp. CCM 9210]
MDMMMTSRHLLADLTTSLDVAGREHLVIVVKASWQIPRSGARPRPIAPQPLEQGDVFFGDPGTSPMKYGSDLVRYKPRCDILFDAQAHAPAGAPVTELVAGFKVGTLQKGVKVIGPRKWRVRLGMASLTRPDPFVSMPLHYGFAFGGTRTYQKGSGDKVQTLTETLAGNPVGQGWVGPKTGAELHDLPAPSLEALSDPVRSPTGKHRPAAFSAVARQWPVRRQYAGTYDAHWQQHTFPFLPEDFDEQFHQCAPADQQIPYPKGGEEVVLLNLMAGHEIVRFKLPALDKLQIRVLRKDYSVATPVPVVDTLYFEPDSERFTAVWRASVPVLRRIQEFDTVAIGPIDLQWWSNKILGVDGNGCIGCDSRKEAA